MVPTTAQAIAVYSALTAFWLFSWAAQAILCEGYDND